MWEIVSHLITSRDTNQEAGVYIVTSKASLPDGRCTESIGAVNIAGLKGEAYANAIMKAETKAKRRATLDLLGLGVLDESEAESIPNATTVALQTMVEALPQMEVEAVEVIEEDEQLKYFLLRMYLHKMMLQHKMMILHFVQMILLNYKINRIGVDKTY